MQSEAQEFNRLKKIYPNIKSARFKGATGFGKTKISNTFADKNNLKVISRFEGENEEVIFFVENKESK